MNRVPPNRKIEVVKKVNERSSGQKKTQIASTGNEWLQQSIIL